MRYVPESWNLEVKPFKLWIIFLNLSSRTQKYQEVTSSAPEMTFYTESGKPPAHGPINDQFKYVRSSLEQLKNKHMNND